MYARVHIRVNVVSSYSFLTRLNIQTCSPSNKLYLLSRRQLQQRVWNTQLPRVGRRGVSTQSPASSSTSVPTATTTTVSPKTWVDRAPISLRPYLYLMRIEKPVGTLLLFYPCTWSITMASYATHAPWTIPLTYISLFGLGALIMRSAGCTINDMADKDFDKAVERTKDRPIARGDITRKQALGFLAAELTGGLAVLTQLNWYSILLGAASLPVVALYPFMKRYTYWPQSVLGLAFNWGALLGWSAVAGSVDWATALPLYAGGVCWTIVYDTIYAHQDKADDVKVGVRSTALLFGAHTRAVLSAFSLSSVSFFTLAGYVNAHGLPYYAGVGLAGWQLARVLWRTNFDDRKSCWDGFRACGWAGAVLWAGAAADYGMMLAGWGSPVSALW